MILPKIFIVDDHLLFRSGIKLLIQHSDIGEIIGEAGNGKIFLDALDTLQPDIVLMDIDMPIVNGIQATKIAVKRFPEIKVIVLSMKYDEKYYVDMIEAGAKGFILKSSGAEELKNAVEQVFQGGAYFSNELLRNIIAKKGINATFDINNNNRISFTDRELEIIKLISSGLLTSEIAEKLFLSPKTIENYRTKLLEKTACRNSVSLIVYALKNKIIQI